MRHRIPTPGMSDRVFTILLASGRAAYARREFFTVTVPLDAPPAALAPAARFPAPDGGGWPRGGGGSGGGGAASDRFVRGAYVAVERVRCVRESEWREELARGVPGARTAAGGKAGRGKKKAPAESNDGGAGEKAGEPEYIYWDMATTADAGGKVPPALQKMGLASHVVVDVGLMLKWVQKWREGWAPEDQED
jgi:hypothetical protein